MSPAQRQKLQAVCDHIEARRNANVRPDTIIAELVADHGARFNVRYDANRLRAAGVAVSCTWSRGDGLLNNWVRTATVHLMRASAEVQG